MVNRNVSDVLYPPVVIAHINGTMENYFRWRVKNKKEVQIHYSSQPNGYPHLGTMTGLMTAFAIGEFIKEHFDLPSRILFEQLENAPGYKIERGGITYQLMLLDTPMRDTNKLDSYMDSFVDLMSWLSGETGIEYTIMSYKDFQEKPFVRSSLLEIMNRAEEFIPILNPKEGKLKIRFPCNECRYMDEDCETLKIEELRDNYARLSMKCFTHGTYEIEITPDNKEFVDFNTPIRNAIKERYFVEEAKKANALNLMVDGADWVGMGELMNHVLGLWGYGIEDLPTRIYTPLIEDWSGAKFSKSVYVKEGVYDYIPPYLMTYPELVNKYGEDGLTILLDETREWARDPKKLFRNYTVEYFKALFSEKLSN